MSENVDQILGRLANIKTILGVGGGLLAVSTMGLAPKVGIFRAFTLGLRSFFKSTHPESVRKAEVARLKAEMDGLLRSQYIVIVGGKGVGKSCLADTALKNQFGVIKLSTESGASKGVITNQVLEEITGIRLNFFDLSANARRVIFFYNLFFKLPPIILLRVPERQLGEQYAQITSAVRGLADDFGLRVIVDGSPNSVPPELLATNRQTVLNVEPMTRSMIEEVLEFQKLIQLLRGNKMDDAVWRVLGGNPAKYNELNKIIGLNSIDSTREIVERIKVRLQSELLDALNKILKCSPNTELILKQFQEIKVERISLSKLKTLGFQVDFPSKVFREVRISNEDLIEPATAAIGLIITQNIVNGVGVDDFMQKIVS